MWRTSVSSTAQDGEAPPTTTLPCRRADRPWAAQSERAPAASLITLMPVLPGLRIASPTSLRTLPGSPFNVSPTASPTRLPFRMSMPMPLAVSLGRSLAGSTVKLLSISPAIDPTACLPKPLKNLPMFDGGSAVSAMFRPMPSKKSAICSFPWHLTPLPGSHASARMAARSSSSDISFQLSVAVIGSTPSCPPAIRGLRC